METDNKKGEKTKDTNPSPKQKSVSRLRKTEESIGAVLFKFLLDYC